MQKYDKPNFLVVGAAKSGTTSLYGYLKQHPDVFLPDIKECRYFSDLKGRNLNPFSGNEHVKIITEASQYYELFSGARTNAIGDISPDYLYYHQSAIPRIIEELGREVKIIILLREPVQRAYSNYMHMVREGFGDMSFEDVIDAEAEWEREGVWHGFLVAKSSEYADAVAAYQKHFDHCLVMTFEAFVADRPTQLRRLCRFLGIDNQVSFEAPSFTNKTGVPKRGSLYALVRKLPLKHALIRLSEFIMGKERFYTIYMRIKERSLEKKPIPEKTRQKLSARFEPDVRRLKKLLNSDLAEWEQ